MRRSAGARERRSETRAEEKRPQSAESQLNREEKPGREGLSGLYAAGPAATLGAGGADRLEEEAPPENGREAPSLEAGPEGGREGVEENGGAETPPAEAKQVNEGGDSEGAGEAAGELGSSESPRATEGEAKGAQPPTASKAMRGADEGADTEGSGQATQQEASAPGDSQTTPEEETPGESEAAESPTAKRSQPGSEDEGAKQAEEPTEPGRVVELREPAGALNAPSDAKHRLPSFAELKSAYTSSTLKVPEKVIKDQIRRILVRMKKNKKLEVSDSVDVIMGRLFPSPGTIDEAEFKRIVDVSKRSRVYKSVLDAEARVKSGDKAKLKKELGKTATLATNSGADTTKLKLVFGSKHATAKGIYDKIATALTTLSSNIDTKLTVDYNLDANALGLGGWAQFSTQRMHLRRSTAKVTDIKRTRITLMHEGAHLADNSVDDHVYYKTKGFESKREGLKIGNAAHFEEVPRRKMGKSRFPAGTQFTPGVTSSGSKQTTEEKIRAYGRNYLRKAWDRAVDYQLDLGEIRREIVGGSTSTFDSNKAKIIYASKVLGWTIHKQQKSKATVTQLDVVVAENMAGAVAQHRAVAKTHPIPKGKGSVSKRGRAFVRSVLNADKEMLGAKRWRIVWYLHKRYKKGW